MARTSNPHKMLYTCMYILRNVTQHLPPHLARPTILPNLFHNQHLNVFEMSVKLLMFWVINGGVSRPEDLYR